MEGRSKAPRPGTAGDAVSRRLVIGVLLTAVALVALALGGLVLLAVQARIVEEGAGALNLAGRQRMLSQRAALLAVELAVVEDPVLRADLRRQIEQTAETLEETHRRLTSPTSREYAAFRTAAARVLVEEPPHRLGARLGAYLEELRRLAAAEPARRDDPRLEALVATALGGELLAALETQVAEIESETRHRVSRLRAVAVLVLAAAVLGVLLTSRFLLLPMMRASRERLEELRRSRLMLELTIENSPLGIATCAIDGRLLTANPALSAMLGRPPPVLAASRLLDLVHEGDRAAVGDRVAAAARGEVDRFEVPCRWLGAQGDVLHGKLHCGVVVSALGRPRRLIALVEDRTAQTLAREEARADRERLAHVNRLATMGEMAAGIAHEINQPLTAVAAYAQACRRLVESGRARGGLLLETLGKIGAQAERAGEVIRRLRSFVKKRRTQAELADVNDIVRDAVELVRADHLHLDVTVGLELAPELPTVMVDRVQIQQVVLNLVRNGIEAAEGGDGDACVTARTAVVPGERVEVSVEDNGRGLPAELRSHLFEPFVTTKSSGLGMGLAISRSIVTSHGGRLWWSPRSQGGTAFHFTLPAAVAGEVAGEAAVQQSA